VTLELLYPAGLPWGYGLTSGAVALVANVSIYVALSYLLPQSQEEQKRIHALFSSCVNPEHPARAPWGGLHWS
jgi:SSS family solute:Na+ symporter